MLILASGSPQRKRILNNLGIAHKAIPSHVEETHDGLKRPHAIAKHLALKKAREVSSQFPSEWVLGVDTLVVLPNGEISGKPESRAQAQKTIQAYRGRYCSVYSGIALINRELNKKFVQYEKTVLLFHNFPDETIEHYLDQNDWQGSSGSMTIEGEGGKLIKRVKGEYWNVVGLPINTLKKLMKKARIS